MPALLGQQTAASLKNQQDKHISLTTLGNNTMLPSSMMHSSHFDMK